ncbi:ABC transporter [Phytophthora megakarya]|uniref:ABC transporter n=1 Tax=Phytophthora megakarya TaxID=4795 RepID=A0A225WPA5_9STRA|nr:ABC transporter [Phytophthora megakarya]
MKNVSISADIVVKEKTNNTTELPTLVNTLIQSARGLTPQNHTKTKQIVSNVTGVFKPGTMTLLLGQPGSGKSSLMKLLSGRFSRGGNVSISGEVTYNGIPAAKLKHPLPHLVSYAPQRDEHHPLLTTKETLEFAHLCRGSTPPEYQAKHSVDGTPTPIGTGSQHSPNNIIHQYGLDNCQHTVVGDAMQRGVSGGERKRVTTAEMEFGDAYVKLMDEASTGLDSSTTFDIMTMQRNNAKEFMKTIVVSLLQPSPEVFALFDDVMILNEGYVMYHGPCKEVRGFFERLGLECPPQRDLADFLMDLGTKKQYQYELVTGIVPHTAREFAEAFEHSDVFARTLENIDNHTHSNQVVPSLPEFRQAFWTSTSLLMRREMTMMKRDMSGLIGRLVMNTIMALLYGFVFYQFDPANPQLVMGIIFEAALCLSLAQSAQIPGIMSARGIFYKQRGANFYRTISYVLSSSMSQMPLIILETVVFSSIVFWMCGFTNSSGSFVLFATILCLINIAFSAFFFFLACASPNVNVANPLSSFTVVFFVLFAGFTITKDQIPDYLIWLYWINPVGWGVRALAVNEYTAPRFDACVYEGTDFCATYGMKMGEYALSMYEVPADKFWIWYGILYVAASYVFFILFAFFALEYHRYENPESVVLNKSEDLDDEYAIAQTPHRSPCDSDVVLSVVPGKRASFIPVTVAFNNLWYSVPDAANPKKTIDLLKGISGYAIPGTITALMGSSGAGKTTLLDVLAGRKTSGIVQGEILLNGYPATDLAIRRSTGYCEQIDIHSASSTIREALTFSAFLRQGAEVPDDSKHASVNSCLDLLDLVPFADRIIRGSSMEQMKRLTIGVELVAQPSVLFLDEPTSGLDAQSAKLIMNGVRRVANTGRTVICTIHQPSAEVFQVFDNLWLLKRGGTIAFAGKLGKNGREMIDYFESMDGVEKMQQTYNPATWMLEVIGAGVGTSSSDQVKFEEMFLSSPHFELLQSKLKEVSSPSPTMPLLSFSNKRAATETTQMIFLLKRFANMYWRTPSHNLTRFAISLVFGLISGTTYRGTDFKSYAGVNSGMGMVFSVLGFLGITSFNTMIPVAAEGRAVFYRERAGQTYNTFWYFFGSSVVEIPYVFVAVLSFMALFYPLVGFTDARTFVEFYLILSVHVLLFAYLAELAVYLSPNVEVAEILGMILNLITFLFAGFSPPAASLPSGVKWIYHINPLTYALAALSASLFGDCTSDPSSAIGCIRLTNTPLSFPEKITVKKYLESNFGIRHNEITENSLILVAFVVFFRILTLLAMRFLNFQKK